MFYRICRMLTLNIQLVFVFDGPGIPSKRGRQGAIRPKYEELRLLKQMLTCFGIPYQEAPGEAEAECARLQKLGIVDAVWSQDSDCLMFGCTLWIHDDRVPREKGNYDRSKENTKKNAKTVRVVRASEMEEKLGLSSDALVLFAMLVGGDYDTVGLRGCGAGMALRAAKNKQLVRSLVSCKDQEDCNVWSRYLAEWFRTIPRGGTISVPQDYPNFKILQKYYKPKVSSDEKLLSSAKLNRDNVRPIDELKLLEVTSSRFNIWGKGYMNWVGPVLLVRWMAARDASLPCENIHDIRMVKQHLKKTGEQEPVRLLERKIDFSPFKVTGLQRKDFEGERLGYWAGSRDILIDLTHRVACELPDFWLAKALPPEVYNLPAPLPKFKTAKRKQQAEHGEQSPEISMQRSKSQRTTRDTDAKIPSLHRRETAQSLPEPVSSNTLSHQRAHKQNTTSAGKAPAPPGSGSTRRRRPPADSPSDVIELSSGDDDLALRVPLRGREHGLAQLRAVMSSSADVDIPTSPIYDIDDLESSVFDKTQPSFTTVSNMEDNSWDDEDLSAAIRESLCEYDTAHSPQKAGESSRIPNTNRHLNHPSPMSSLPYPGLPSSSQVSISRQNPTEGSFIPSPLPPAYSLHTPSRPGPVHFTSALELVSAYDFSSTPIPSRLAMSSEQELIREARLRHFAQNSSPVTAVHSRLSAPANGIAHSSPIPDGDVCIDLTND